MFSQVLILSSHHVSISAVVCGHSEMTHLHLITQIKWADSKRWMWHRWVWSCSVALCSGGVFLGGLMEPQPRISLRVGCSYIGRRLGHVCWAMFQMFSPLGVGQCCQPTNPNKGLGSNTTRYYRRLGSPYLFPHPVLSTIPLLVGHDNQWQRNLLRDLGPVCRWWCSKYHLLKRLSPPPFSFLFPFHFWTYLYHH